MKKVGFMLLLVVLGGCTNTPLSPPSVGDFELKRYLGRWYEIARITHSFERNMDYVYTEYSLGDDGGVKVVNSGVRNGKRHFVTAQAYQLGEGTRGNFKIAFFWPFYGSYRVIALEPDYSVAMITSGNNRSYFWILARTPTVDSDILQRFLTLAEQWGFEMERIEYPKPMR